MINQSLSAFIGTQSVNDYLNGTISNETPQLLVVKVVKQAAKKIRQGFGPLNWNSLSVDAYLDEAKGEAARLEAVCKNVLKTIDSINQNIRQIKNTRLIPTQLMLYQGTELAYAAPQTNLALSINSNNIKNGHKREESPTALYIEALRNAQMKQAAKDERLFE